MYHFDYVTKHGGAVFENCDGGGMVTVNGQKRFTFNDFLNIFVFIENYKHPFTITTTAQRMKRLEKQLEKLGYTTLLLKAIDIDFGEENANLYGAHHINQPNPFRHTKEGKGI